MAGHLLRREILIALLTLSLGCAHNDPPPTKTRATPDARPPGTPKLPPGIKSSPSKGDVPAGIIGTWEWKNPLGGAELRLGVFPDKHVIFNCNHCPDDALKIYQGDYLDGYIEFPEFLDNTEQLMQLVQMDRETLIAVSINAQGDKEATAMVWRKSGDDPWKILNQTDAKSAPTAQKPPVKSPPKGAATSPARQPPQPKPAPGTPPNAPVQSKTAPPAVAPAGPPVQPKPIPPTQAVPASPVQTAPAPTNPKVSSPPQSTPRPANPSNPVEPAPKPQAPPPVQLPSP